MKIEAKAVEAVLSGSQILRGVDLEIGDRELVGVIGPNGSGKSTLLKCIYRVLKPAAGAVYLDGRALDRYPYKESARSIAVVAQHNYYNFDFSVRDVVLMGRAPHKRALERDNAEDYSIVAESLETVGMSAFADRSFSTLSGGEQQRVILARALAQRTACLILDEPTNHLDITSKEILEDALNDYEGTILYVSHDRYFINRTAHRILELSGKTLTGYLGNYDCYLENKTENAASNADRAADASGSSDTPVMSSAKAEWQAKKAAQAKQRKLENDLKKTETRIAELEQKITDIDTLMASEEVCRNSAKLSELSAEQKTWQEELDHLYEEWERLSEIV